MNKNAKFSYLIWLIIASLIVAIITYVVYQPKDQIFETKISYTVVPKTAVLRGNYQDLQASNLFIDIIKAWLYSPSIQNELNDNLIDSTLAGFRSTSMQTFEITAAGIRAESASSAAIFVDEIINREVTKHANFSGAGGYEIVGTELHEATRSPKIFLNILLAFVTTFAIGGFLILLLIHKPKH